MTFPLLSDFNKQVIRDYGVFNEDMIGLKGIAKRAVFVLDKDGVVRHREVLDDARNEPDYEKVYSTPGLARLMQTVRLVRVTRRRASQRDAVHVVVLAALDFHLDGRVRDVEAALEIVDDGAQDLLAFADALFGHDDVAAAGDHAGAHHPDVQIVNVEHAGDAFDRVDHAPACRSRRACLRAARSRSR